MKQESIFCSRKTQELGEPIEATAPTESEYLIFEVPPPWNNPIITSKNLNPKFKVFLANLSRENPQIRLIGILPDKYQSDPSLQRVFHLFLPPNNFQKFSKKEFLIPTSLSAGFLTEFLSDSNRSSTLQDEYAINYSANTKELLVCTHGRRDTCCGKFGYPIYNELLQFVENGNPDIRVWRCSHIVGHRFAPTLVDFPQGRFFGRVDVDDLTDIVIQDYPAEKYGNSFLRRIHRGQAGLSEAEQYIDHALLIKEGYHWDLYRKTFSSILKTERKEVFKYRVTAQLEDKTRTFFATLKKNEKVKTCYDCGGNIEKRDAYKLTNLLELL